MAPGDVAEALGRGADLRELGVAEVVAEHGLVVAVGLAVAGGGAIVALVIGLVVVGLLHQDQALDGHQHLYSTVQYCIILQTTGPHTLQYCAAQTVQCAVCAALVQSVPHIKNFGPQLGIPN